MFGSKFQATFLILKKTYHSAETSFKITIQWCAVHLVPRMTSPLTPFQQRGGFLSFTQPMDEANRCDDLFLFNKQKTESEWSESKNKGVQSR